MVNEIEVFPVYIVTSQSGHIVDNISYVKCTGTAGYNLNLALVIVKMININYMIVL